MTEAVNDTQVTNEQATEDQNKNEQATDEQIQKALKLLFETNKDNIDLQKKLSELSNGNLTEYNAAKEELFMKAEKSIQNAIAKATKNIEDAGYDIDEFKKRSSVKELVSLIAVEGESTQHQSPDTQNNDGPKRKPYYAKVDNDGKIEYGFKGGKPSKTFSSMSTHNLNECIVTHAVKDDSGIWKAWSNQMEAYLDKPDWVNEESAVKSK
ncbi:TPA: hypothetical protein NG565_001780 [Vibrio parahaemolyticus]|nr:hypothetical protein [Vibrio parahaemolyticus]